MMTHELEVSILTAPLAAIDRRALSQAWYAALHLARPQPRPVSSTARRGTASPGNAPSRARSESTTAGACELQARPSRGCERDAPTSVVSLGTSCAANDRARSVLSRRIELRFTSSSPPVRRATFSLGPGSARVHVIVQTNGNTARLIAICRPELRSVVARALSEARLTLAARGIPVAVTSRS